MTTPSTDARLDRINWFLSIPFLLAHLGLALVFVVGFRWEWLLLAVATYAVRMFGVTAGYHRYFSHRAFKTGRVFQFVLAFLAQSSAQKGALWWAALHRHHHRYSDTEEDVHSPARKGFWWSHAGWILADRYNDTRLGSIKDFAKYPELVWLNRFHVVPALVGGVGLFLAGGLPWLVWGGLVSTVALWHGTFFINSLTHVFGRRRYLTTDTSRNNFLLALVTLGEGWHNNHHYHQNTANQGWFWWEVDVTFYVLKVLELFGVVSELRLPSDETRYAYERYTDEQRAQLKAETSFNMFRRPKLPEPRPSPEAAPSLSGLRPTAAVFRR